MHGRVSSGARDGDSQRDRDGGAEDSARGNVSQQDRGGDAFVVPETWFCLRQGEMIGRVHILLLDDKGGSQESCHENEGAQYEAVLCSFSIRELHPIPSCAGEHLATGRSVGVERLSKMRFTTRTRFASTTPSSKWNSLTSHLARIQLLTL